MSAAQPSSEWMESAACTQYPGELWYPEPSESGTEAKRICGTCPVQIPCLERAMAAGEPWGIWGGLGPGSRNSLRKGEPITNYGDKTHCANDHEFTPENTAVRPKGGRVCRTCKTESVRRSQAKRRAA